ncbi:MAG: DUF2914 domain-containing protein [Alphaproteobacteria bacterium]|nr:DUF2914 domain-containing protein [Alphaproteobacteria bacterium]
MSPNGHSADKGWISTFKHYERHLSAAAMVVGYIVDNFAFGRIDHRGAHLIFGSYLAAAAITIAMSHMLQERADRKAERQANKEPPGVGKTPNGDAGTAIPPGRIRRYLPAATQFALGGLWSGFLVFYSRSASLAASWLFLCTLGAFLVGNEIFRRYHERLVFAALLFFFATYSYAIFTVPLVTKTIGKLTFLASGAVAIFIFLLFLSVLSIIGRKRYLQSRWQLLAGAAAITAAMNAFYFMGILPPLPLALTRIGIYHEVKHKGDVYIAKGEPQSWLAQYGLEKPVVHLRTGEPLSLYAAVFAPVRLSTRIQHLWQIYDPKRKRWIIQSGVSFPISGGRGGGYRAYTVKTHPAPGEWRVDVLSEDGRLIGRLNFILVQTATPAAVSTVTLN